MKSTAALILAAALFTNNACTGGTDESTFEGDCGAKGTCAQLSARWTLTSADKTSTCTDLDASKVVLTATFQADGRAATFENTCGAGALVTSAMPLGPYMLTLALQAMDGTVLSQATTQATLGVANTVSETRVSFDVVPRIRNGGLFGLCTSSMPCKDPKHLCIAMGTGSGFCSPRCLLSSTSSSTTCDSLYQTFGTDSSSNPPIECNQTPESLDSNIYGACFILCGVGKPACLDGLTCQQHPVHGSVCAP